jgi:hypothetical protein
MHHSSLSVCILTHYPTNPCRFSDAEVQRDAKLVSYKIVDKGGKPYVSVDVKGEQRVFSPEEVCCRVGGGGGTGFGPSWWSRAMVGKGD